MVTLRIELGLLGCHNSGCLLRVKNIIVVRIGVLIRGGGGKGNTW